MIDLRSDTITQPTPGMRRVIADAAVGDDVFGEDPTVTALEARVAQILGKEAAVYVPSGTMANQLAVRTHTQPGDEIIVEAHAHIYYYEAGATAALSGVICRTIDTERGVFSPADLEACLRPPDEHYAPTRLVCIENTHNYGGGVVWSLDDVAAVAQAARQQGLQVHLDGARLWNAAVASGVPERDYAALSDSVSVCFSKGLGAPVGSALAGAADFIARARRHRKQFGGGMRQAGLLAAAALYALEHHRDRLAQDHENARRLAQGLAEIEGVEIDPQEVQTNIVRFQTPGIDAAEVVRKLDDRGVRVFDIAPYTIRAVTNLMVTASQIPVAIEAVREVLSGFGSPGE